MMLESYKNLVSTSATIITILQFSSGIEICHRIRKQGYTGDISGFPFVGGIFATSSWFIYGYLLMDAPMMITNSIGFALQTVFLIIYLQYCITSPSVKTIRKQMAPFFLVTFCIIYFSFFSGFSEDVVKYYVGLTCCTASIIFCATPLYSLSHVIKTKSTETLPFPLILTMFFMGGLWSLYGIIIANQFVFIPNSIGCLLATFQLSLFVIYAKDNKKYENFTTGIL